MSEPLSPEREAEIREAAHGEVRLAPRAWMTYGLALLAEIDRLRAELGQVSSEVARFGIYGGAVAATKALVKRADELVNENAALRAEVANWHSTRDALCVILKHGDMSDTVRQEISLLISDEPDVDGAGRTRESYQPTGGA